MKITNCMILLLLVNFCISPIAFSGDLDFGDEINAKLAREKAKSRRFGRSNSSGSGGDSGKCGSSELGNVVNERGSRGTKEVTVIVTGDVINANVDCK